MSSSIHAAPPPPVVEEPSGIRYATGTALGKGGFAICHRAERMDFNNKPTGHVVALKIVKTKMEPAKLAQKFVTELQIHSKLSHPNIVAFYRAFSFQTSTYVVLEICPNGSLADMLKRRKFLTLPEIRRFVIQICGAVKYLHHRHIVHRDLKTGNLFLDENMNVKVGDFGLAALLVTEREMEVKRRTTMCGTPNYLAPEILEKGKGHNEKVDIWSIGVIVYTLAVGKAPFHASSKEEIYKKLRSGEYTWPELSATSNDISSDLRSLVASVLVPEEERPTPDKLISHPFFKIAYVPAGIPTSAKERAPQWSEAALPSLETQRRGYSETWWAVCKHSGVGEYTEGKAFPLNGGKKVKSIVYEIHKEAESGKQPTMPIPRDTVYTSTISFWTEPSPPPSELPEPVVHRTQERGLMQPPCRGLKEISNNEVAISRPPSVYSGKTDAELMPPPARPSSRIGKTNTVRRAARTISEETAAQSQEGLKIASDEPQNGIRVTKTRHTPAAASSTLKSSTHSSNSATQSSSSQGLEEATAKSQRAGTTKRSADASLARRPRAATKKDHLPTPPGQYATLEELKHASPIRRPRRKQPEPKVIEILEDAESDAHPARRGFNGATLNLPPPSMMSRALPVPRRKTSDADIFQGTDPDEVLYRLNTLRDNLASAMKGPRSHRSAASNRSTPGEAAQSLPFVSRWVDYSRKHGVGYVLEDGTVGCIINASPKNGGTPVTHIFVRKGQKWLSRVGKDFEHIERLPIEIFEDKGELGIGRKVYKGLGSVKEGPHLVEAERRRTLSVLWVKFGRYMCQSLSGEEDASAAVGDSTKDTNFVRFYQRIGSVGIWAFADGCLQVHFPDHTKLVLSADGKLISATCITVEAARYLEQCGELMPHHVSGREVHADTISSLLHEGGRMRQRIVDANKLGEKLSFVLQVVEQWIDHRGLGKVDEDERRGERLCWEGMSVKDNARKVDRVTVGRFGGDEARVVTTN
ncbi:kinase-like protein [Polychaeton citri CBS 116435]|uniref:Kinase-like protein n=1 Tax=Polychaeton citri CBS 116435 TaxID=1314669 RepID=A0A9P4Q0E3_9PEZI|nr:kinase-like protein [Polychaeton citri CBS 116435]